MVPRTERTVVTFSQLRQAILQARERGYALDDEENEEGARCVAAPIFNHQGYAIASISLSAPASRMSDRMVTKAAAAVMQTASAISSHLGYVPKSE